MAAFCVVGKELDALRTQIYSCMEAHGMPLYGGMVADGWPAAAWPHVANFLNCD